MSLLFAVLMTYNRLSQDSEIIAFKSAGVHTFLCFYRPGVCASGFVFVFANHPTTLRRGAIANLKF